MCGVGPFCQCRYFVGNLANRESIETRFVTTLSRWEPRGASCLGADSHSVAFLLGLLLLIGPVVRETRDAFVSGCGTREARSGFPSPVAFQRGSECFQLSRSRNCQGCETVSWKKQENRARTSADKWEGSHLIFRAFFFVFLRSCNG